MIEVKYYYINKFGTPIEAYVHFCRVDSAVKFMYKCKNSKNMIYSGEFSCDDPTDTEIINRRFK